MLQWAQTTRMLCLSLALADQSFENKEKIARLCSDLIETTHYFALAATTKLQQRALLRAMSGIGDLAAYTYAKLGDFEQGFRALSLSRAVGAELALKLSGSQDNFGDSSKLNKALKRWQDLRASIDKSLNQSLSALQNQKAINNATLKAAADAYHDYLREMESSGIAKLDFIDPAQLSGALPENGVLVAFFASEIGGGAFMIPHGVEKLSDINVVVMLDELTTKRLNSLIKGAASGQKSDWLKAYNKYRDQSNTIHEAELERAVVQWNQFIERYLHDIWDVFMGPISHWLEAFNIPLRSDIILMSPGLISILPLHAAKPRDKDGGYFIQDWVVSTITSPRALMAVSSRLDKQDANKKTLLAVTDPLGDIGETVNPVWPFFDATARRNITSTATQFLEELKGSDHWSYISFFGHGVWDVSQPDKSHLVMSDGSILSAEDIGLINLTQTRLVLLGACETGLIGTKHTPDEFIGLPSALIQSGVAGVAASLWLVDAASTYDLLSRFISAHCDGMTPAAALREAQCAFINGEMDDPSATSDTPRSLAGLQTLRLLSASPKRTTKQVVIAVKAPGTIKPAQKQVVLKRTMPFFWAAFVLIGQ